MGRDQGMGGGVDCGTGPRDGWGCRLWDGAKGWMGGVDCGTSPRDGWGCRLWDGTKGWMGV